MPSALPYRIRAAGSTVRLCGSGGGPFYAMEFIDNGGAGRVAVQLLSGASRRCLLHAPGLAAGLQEGTHSDHAVGGVVLRLADP